MDTLETKIPISSNAIWREAMKYGVILGLVTVAFEFLPKLWQPDAASLMEVGASRVSSAFIASAISILLFLVKTGVCIFLMVFFTKKIAAAYDSVKRAHTFRFGMFLALFSGLITAAAILLEVTLIDKNLLSEQIRMMVEMNPQAQSLPDTESVVNTVTGIIPVFGFFFTWVKCFGIGVLVALLISRSIPGRTPNPFEKN